MPWNIAVDNAAKSTAGLRRIAQAWLLLVIAGSLQPKRPAPLLAFHREIHWLAFAGLALLVLLVSRTVQETLQRVLAVLWLGVCLETCQHFLYHTATEWRDVRDDGFAILAACGIYWLAAKCRWLAPDRS
jgi:hypothetical protein